MVINFSLVLNDTYGPDETVKNCGKNTQSWFFNNKKHSKNVTKRNNDVGAWDALLYQVVLCNEINYNTSHKLFTILA
jgi:hypothetical protein